MDKTEIARELKIHKSIVSRELARNVDSEDIGQITPKLCVKPNIVSKIKHLYLPDEIKSFVVEKTWLPLTRKLHVLLEIKKNKNRSIK